MKNKIIYIIVLVLVLLQLYFLKPNKEKINKEPVVTTSVCVTTVSKVTENIVTTISTTDITTDISTLTNEITTVTEPVVEKLTVTTETETEPAVIVVEEPEIVYLVYKPSTHYVHVSNCKYMNSECYEITDTYDIEARLCDECNPDIEIINEYTEPVSSGNTIYVSDYDFALLCEIVEYEAGSDWISTYDKARVANGVMNRVRDSRYPDSVYGVLTQPYQFSGYYVGCKTARQGSIDAVNYYLSHPDEFGNGNSWYGDGYNNYFYYA